ncbi:hypothetical protein GCM10023081_19840 [Arthrobacter ginkgonis]|uniref:Uncharacterized protein n=1 Tax=Arthrobacter ginkgonis TaxID=1630594 RepID=A0ABP7CAC4_9MICC
MADNEAGDRQPGQAADDAAWRDLVRRLEETPSAAGPAEPGAFPPGGALPTDGARSGDPARDSDGPGEGPGAGDDAGGPRDYELLEDDDEGFVPPEPPALGSGEPAKVMAWCGAVGAPLFLLLFTLLWRGVPGLVLLGLAAVFLAATGYLVFRMPRERNEGDDGARV